MVSCFMANPRKTHWLALEWNLGYIKGSLSLGILYGGNVQSNEIISSYSNFDYIGYLDTRKSTPNIFFCYRLFAVSHRSTHW